MMMGDKIVKLKKVIEECEKTALIKLWDGLLEELNSLKGSLGRETVINIHGASLLKLLGLKLNKEIKSLILEKINSKVVELEKEKERLLKNIAI